MHGGSLPRRRFDLHPAAREADALAHADQSEAVAGACGGEPTAVIGHGDVDHAVSLDDRDGDALRLRVLGDVRQRLLNDAVDRCLESGAEPARLVPGSNRGRVGLGVDPGARPPLARASSAGPSRAGRATPAAGR